MNVHEWFNGLTLGKIHKKPSNVTWNEIEYQTTKHGRYPILQKGELYKMYGDNFVLVCKCCGQSEMN